MHSIGDMIIYGAYGVMKIVDIREESVGDQKRKYYVLYDMSSISNSHVFVPVDNKKLTSSMHGILTKDAALELISRIKDVPVMPWNGDNRARLDGFKRVVESGDREGILSIIKTVYENGIRRSEEGKKNYLADEALMRKAKKLIEAELAIALEMDESEVEGFIKANM